ncbi:hypothetical protein ACHAW6_005619, partial [Cyclotella cf. meneghiniana]
MHHTKILKAYEEVYQSLQLQGYQPQLHKLDNETSKDPSMQFEPAKITSSHYKPELQAHIAYPTGAKNLNNQHHAQHARSIISLQTLGRHVLIQQNPNGTNRNQGQTWGYHTTCAWYFALALTCYQCIKALTESGATRVTDTFKFLHHCLPESTVSKTDHIVEATQHLLHTIQGQPNALLDELQTIQQLRDLITGATKCKPTPDPEIDFIPEQEEVVLLVATSPEQEEVVLLEAIQTPNQTSTDPILKSLPMR